MKVLISTTATQGEVEGDYSATLDGELVTPVAGECCSPDTCGCGRGFSGLASSKATTTAMLVDHLHLTRADLVAAFEDALDRQGWLAGLDRAEVDEVVAEHVDAIELIGRSFLPGTILRRDGAYVYCHDHADL